MRKFISLASIFLLAPFLMACQQAYSDSELQANFSEKEIKDLTKIRSFFIDQLCGSDFKTCYEKIDHDYLEASGTGIWENIDFTAQKKLYENISKSTFESIWMYCKAKNYKTNEEKKALCANAIGRYNNYLFDLGKQNPKIKEYADWVNASGDFSLLQLSYSRISGHKKYFDLNDPNIQLILAIHYLSLNDNFKRNEKWAAE